jgi:hypothetical protein
LRSAIRMNFYSLWSIRKTSAARSPRSDREPWYCRGHARHDGSIGNAQVFDSIDLEITVYHRYGITPHFGRVRLMSLGTGCVANEVFKCRPSAFQRPAPRSRKSPAVSATDVRISNVLPALSAAFYHGLYGRSVELQLTVSIFSFLRL